MLRKYFIFLLSTHLLAVNCVSSVPDRNFSLQEATLFLFTIKASMMKIYALDICSLTFFLARLFFSTLLTHGASGSRQTFLLSLLRVAIIWISAQWEVAECTSNTAIWRPIGFFSLVMQRQRRLTPWSPTMIPSCRVRKTRMTTIVLRNISALRIDLKVLELILFLVPRNAKTLMWKAWLIPCQL